LLIPESGNTIPNAERTPSGSQLVAFCWALGFYTHSATVISYEETTILLGVSETHCCMGLLSEKKIFFRF
jgi:hypothetical protein